MKFWSETDWLGEDDDHGVRSAARGVGETVVWGRKLLLTIVIYPYQGGV